MVIRKVSKLEQKSKDSNKRNESDYEKRERDRKEKREREKESEKQKEIDRLAEENRLRTLVRSNVEVVQKHVRGKKLSSFWVFPDRSGFKKLDGISFEKMQKILKEDVNKYKNRKIVHFDIPTYVKPITKKRDEEPYWIVISMIIYPIDKDGIIKLSKQTSCTFGWGERDFKITKFSFKFLEAVMHAVIETGYYTMSIFGIRLKQLLNDLEKKGINFDDVLSPLASA